MFSNLPSHDLHHIDLTYYCLFLIIYDAFIWIDITLVDFKFAYWNESLIPKCVIGNALLIIII